MKRLDLAIDSDLGNVSLVAVSVNRVCLQLGLDETCAGQIELCTAEAVTNAIRHAYHGAPGHRVAVTLVAGRDHVLIEVSDTGTSMPLDKQRKLLHGPEASEVLLPDRRSLSESGRGLEIIRELMDEVSYSKENGRNRLIMRKRAFI